MQFAYKAADRNGKTISGREECDSREQLIAKLKAEGKYPLEVKEETTVALKVGNKRLSKQDLLNFTQQLAGLLSAGIPLEKALSIISRLAAGPEMSRVTTELRRWLQEGMGFTAALERFPEHFPALYINMVRAGEAGGILPQVLKRLAQYIDEEIALKRFIIGSLIYPSIIILASVFAVLVYVGIVIPQFQSIFADAGSDLPWITRVVMFIGGGIRDYWWAILIALGLALVWFFQKKATPRGRLEFDRIKLKLPLIGPIMQKIATSRLALALSLLNGSGVPILNCINITSAIVGNEVMAQALREVEKEVKKGNTLAGSMELQKVFPVLAVEMIGVGEESGNLGSMLEQVAKTYEHETKHAVNIFLTVFEPLLILIMVAVIAVLAVAILLPVIEMNSKLNPMG